MGEVGHAELLGAIWIEGHLFDGAGAAMSAHGAVATICWRHARPSTDSDAPGAFAAILSDALVSLGSIVFIDRLLGHGDGTRQERWTPGGSLFSLPVRAPWWKPGFDALDVMVTRDASILATLGFSEGGWDRQDQVIALMDHAQALKTLKAEALSRWLGPDALREVGATFPHEVRLILIAGHDGEWGSVLARDTQTLHALRNGLRAVLETAGLRWIEGTRPELFRLGGHGPWPDGPVSETDSRS